MKFLIVLVALSVAAADPLRTGRRQNAGGAAQQNTGATGANQFGAVNPFKAVNRFSGVGFGHGGSVGGGHGGANALTQFGYRSGATNPYANNKRVYGMGLNNQWARPHSIFEMNKALNLVKHNPSLLVRVNMDGDIDLTDQFGNEVDELINAFGWDLTEGL